MGLTADWMQKKELSETQKQEKKFQKQRRKY